MKEKFPWLLFWGVSLGNLFEHYDTALFGLLAPFLAPLIFPTQDPLFALILTYAIIPLGMVARPLGALLLGRLGDSWGRSKALVISLGGMAFVSFLMAFLPTFEVAGWSAPLFFFFGRLAQNFLAAGEVMGGGVFLLENAPEKKHDFLSGCYNASTIAGILLASSGVSLCAYLGGVEQGWRYLYLAGSATALTAFLIRGSVQTEAQSNVPASTRGYDLHSFVRVIRESARPLFLIGLGSGFSYVTYTLSLVLLNGFIPLITSFSKESMVNLNSQLLILDFSLLPFCGWIASKVGRKKLMGGTALVTALTFIPAIMLLQRGSFLDIVMIRVLLVALGVAFFAPFSAWAQNLVPKESRFMVISFGYAAGAQLLGAPAAAISLWLYNVTQIPWAVAWYATFIGLLFSAAFFWQEAKERDYKISVG